MSGILIAYAIHTHMKVDKYYTYVARPMHDTQSDTVYCTHLPVYVVFARVLHRELHHLARSGEEGTHHLPHIQYTYNTGKVYTR